MNKKRVRQMNTSLLRKLTSQQNARYLGEHREVVTELVERQNYIQRFVPLYDGSRLSCADVLALCREDLARLSPAPEEGWLAFTYDFARMNMASWRTSSRKPARPLSSIPSSRSRRRR